MTTVKRGGLGRNLSALLSSAGNSAALLDEKLDHAPSSPQRLNLPIDSLQPGRYQPRAAFDDTTITELSESIKKQGLLQPLLVRKLEENKYEIIAGERRWRACQMVDMTQIPVILHQVDDETAMAMALVENLQREDLNAMDQARAMNRLTTEFALTHQQVADLLSKSRTAVTNYLRLLTLNSGVRLLLEHGDIEMGHARCLLSLEDEQQYQVAQLIVAKNLSVRETEALVNRVKHGAPIKAPKNIPPTHFETQLSTLAKQLQTKIKLKPSSVKGKGTLVIHYDDEHKLQTIMDKLC